MQYWLNTLFTVCQCDVSRFFSIIMHNMLCFISEAPATSSQPLCSIYWSNSNANARWEIWSHYVAGRFSSEMWPPLSGILQLFGNTMPKVNKGKKRYWGNKVDEFFSHSSIHGFVYFSGKRNAGDRIIWAFAILVSFIVAMIIIKWQIDESNADPLASNTETISVENVPFPGNKFL